MQSKHWIALEEACWTHSELYRDEFLEYLDLEDKPTRRMRQAILVRKKDVEEALNNLNQTGDLNERPYGFAS